MFAGGSGTISGVGESSLKKIAFARVNRLLGSAFLKDVLKLSAGTLLGRSITIISLPVVTRLYSPEEFKLLAVYLSVISILSVIACFRLEIAIPLAKNDEDAVNLQLLALLVLFLFVSLVTAAVFLRPDEAAQLIGQPTIAPFLWLVPVGTAMVGSYAIFQFWATRLRRFGEISRTRIGQAVVGSATLLSLGWAGVAPLGLLLGNTLNTGAGGLSLGLSALRRDRVLYERVSITRMRAAFSSYYRYPVYSTPEALFNVAGLQVPILIIAAQGGDEAGFILLAIQVMTVPMTLLGGSVSQVYMSRLPEEFRKGMVAPFTFDIVSRLLLIGAGPILLIGALGPIIFPKIFGAQWTQAGEMLFWLAPWMVLQFIVSPVSTVMLVVGKQSAMLALTTIGLMLRVGATLFAPYSGFFSAYQGFAIGSMIYYVVFLIFVFYAAKIPKYQILQLVMVVFKWPVAAPISAVAIIMYLSKIGVYR